MRKIFSNFVCFSESPNFDTEPNPKSFHFELLIKSLFTKRFRDWSCGKLRNVLCCVLAVFQFCDLRVESISRISTLHFHKIFESVFNLRVYTDISKNSSNWTWWPFGKFGTMKFVTYTAIKRTLHPFLISRDP